MSADTAISSRRKARLRSARRKARLKGASVVTAPEGAPVALAAIGAVGRRFRALSQSDVQRAIQAMLGAPGPLDAFIHAAVADDAVRRERTERLREQARPFSYADFLPTAE